MASVIASIDEWVAKTPDKTCLSFLDSNAFVTDALSYADLQRRTSRLAKYLVKDLALTGKHVLLVYPPSLDFIVAFLACIKAGVIAVPASPPSPDARKTDLRMFSSICKSCGAKVALTSAKYDWAVTIAGIKTMLISHGNKDELSSWPALSWHVTDSIVRSAKNDMSDTLYAATAGNGDQVAFLQYTSGSPSAPRGLMVSHVNISHNLQLMSSSLATSPNTVVVSWLAQHSDMGLLGSYLGVLHCGGSGFYLSPDSFLRSPPLWIRCINKFRATHLQAPDFAYALSAKKFMQSFRRHPVAFKWVPKLDLSCVKHILNSGERVSLGAMELFEGVFCPYGLPLKAFVPTYSLAEHTLFVSGSKGGAEGNNGDGVVVLRAKLDRLNAASSSTSTRGYDAANAETDADVPQITLCSHGQPADSMGVTVVIVAARRENTEPEDDLLDDPKSQVPDGVLGEVWVSSQSVSKGYYENPEATRQTFGGKVKNELYRDLTFLKTGDLGFMFKGNLFLHGRLRENIIVRGRHHYPLDIEKTAEAVKAPGGGAYLLSGHAAVFRLWSAADGPGEEFGVVAELSSHDFASRKVDQGFFKEALTVIRREIAAEHGINASYVALTGPRATMISGHGKVARGATRFIVETKGSQRRQWKKQYVVCEYDPGMWIVDPIVYPADTSTPESDKQSLTSFVEDELDCCVPKTVHPTDILPKRRKSSSVFGDEDAIDPTGTNADTVLRIILEDAEACLDPKQFQAGKSSVISPDAKVTKLGIDSMRLVSNLEKRFTVPIPNALLAEADCTLRNIATCLTAGGRLRPRPYMISASRLVTELTNVLKPVLEEHKKNPIVVDEKYPQGLYDLPVVSSEWLEIQATKSDLMRHTFPSGSCSSQPERCAKMVPADALFFNNVQWAFLVVGNETLIFSLRIMMYCSVFMYLFRTRRWVIKLITVLGLFLIDALPNRFLTHDSYINTENLAVFQNSKVLKCLCDFFSFRFIVESPIDAKVPTMMLTSGIRVNRVDEHTRFFSKDVPVLQAAIATGMLHVFMRFLHGFETKTFLPPNIQVGGTGYNGKPFWPYRYSFLYKYTSQALQRLGFRGNLDFSEIADTVVDIVYGEEHGGQVPHIGLAYDSFEEKSGEMLTKANETNIHAIRLALIMGYQIVPCVQLHNNIRGHWDDHKALSRSNMVVVTGRPIQCPRLVERGSTDLNALTEDLVAEYHNMYKGEIKRMAQQYANIYVGSN